MAAMSATAGAPRAFHVGLVLTAFVFGLRHGIDWDHIAALTDITSAQENPERSMWFATLYTLGHALVVFVLGFTAIVWAQRLPDGIDAIMNRLVGLTLLMLGCCVLYALARHGRDFRMRSRWMLMISGVRRCVHWVRTRAEAQPEQIEHDYVHAVADVHDLALQHAHARTRDDDAVVMAGARSGTIAPTEHRPRHRHVVPLPDDPFASYARGTAFGIGMIHGIGAETPTQVLIFVTAAGAGGEGTGLLLLVAFLAGLVTSNSVVA